MKYFIITVDTEGDDQWSWKAGKEITVENVKYLPRFQQLCNKYGFKPVYLSDYEMLQDAGYVDFISAVEVSDGKLTETIKADYFSTLRRIDRAAFYKKAHSSRKYGALPSELTRSDSRENI